MRRKKFTLIVFVTCLGWSVVFFVLISFGVSYAVLTERQAPPNDVEQHYAAVFNRAEVKSFSAAHSLKRPIVVVLDNVISRELTRRFGDAGVELKQESQAWKGTTTQPIEQAKTVVWITSYSPKAFNFACTSGDNQTIEIVGYAYWDVTLIDTASESIVDVRSKRFKFGLPSGNADEAPVDAVVSYVLGFSPASEIR